MFRKIAEGDIYYEGRDGLVSVGSRTAVLPDGKLLVLQGVDDLLVVDSGDMLMICRKGNEGDIRKILNDTKMKLGENMA